MKEIAFPWLTAGILQIFLCFYFHCRGCERARRMTAHSNMAGGFCLDLKCVICKRFSAFVVACITFQIYYGANQNVRIGVTLAASHRKFPLSLFFYSFILLSLILQYIKDQQVYLVQRFSRCLPPAEWVSIMCENGWKGQRLRVTLRYPLTPPIVPTLNRSGFKGGGPSHIKRTLSTSAPVKLYEWGGLCKRRRRCHLLHNGPDPTLTTSSWSLFLWDLKQHLSCKEWAI